MRSVDNKVISRVYGWGMGCSFFLNDFSDLASGDAIRKSLSRLEQSQQIRRVIRGVYDYPKFSKKLNKLLSPDIQQIAFTLARKFHWNISPTGDTALNILGLSTQVPGRYIYLCNGVNRSYQIGQLTLEFKKVTLKEIGFKYRESDLLVQAIKVLGKERLSNNVIEQLRAQFNSKQGERILKDTKRTTTWIYDAIKMILSGADK